MLQLVASGRGIATLPLWAVQSYLDRGYVGISIILDAHASSCTLAVIGPHGTRVGSHVVETNAKALIDVV